VTRQTHDQFAKSLLSEFLEPWGQVEVSREVTDEPRSIDLYFQPDPQRQPLGLGLLGRMAGTPCLLEPYRNPVTPLQIRACLLKALTVRAAQERTDSESDPPQLWILTPTASKQLLAQFGAQPDQHWPSGIYLLPSGLRGGIGVIHQLAGGGDTLWLRLLGRGRVQQGAIEEVMAMGSEDPERLRVLELLGNWKIVLDEKREALREEERELIMNLSPAYLKWKEETLHEGEQRGIEIGQQRGIEIGQQRGEQRGIQIGEQRGIEIGQQRGFQREQELTLRLLRRKVGALSPEQENQIRALGIEQLESLSEALLDFSGRSDLSQWFEENSHP